ncbi:replication initiator protein A [Staphylococcus saprophyticus]|uniref:replication initiator protein A n=1 Tax=Staphylococcus TaxID=1279 RepID=UPI0014037619|nr:MULTISPECIES: replication initiator protein A [Staphylococcus]MDW4003479.1 replication initiator protein A [Staphylococcus saprophyticus]
MNKADIYMGQSYYKLFNFLFTDDKYKDLSYGAKLLFALLVDREEQTRDRETKHFTYKRKDMEKDLLCSKGYMEKSLHELKVAQLVNDVRVNHKTQDFDSNEITIIYDGISEEPYMPIPKILFTDDKYKSLSRLSIIMYALFRYEYVNNLKFPNSEFIDEDNNTFCSVYLETLKRQLNISFPTLHTAKSKLVNANLIYQVKGATLREPLRTYVYDPD